MERWCNSCRVQIVSDLKPDHQRWDLHKSNLPVTSRKIGPVLITTTHLKPYFYVLNNLLHLTLDPKIGDSIHIMLDAPKVLCRFGASGDRYSITDFMWRKIERAANDPHKSLPYASFLMYIIEQVVGRSFHHNAVHKSYSVHHVGPKGYWWWFHSFSHSWSGHSYFLPRCLPLWCCHCSYSLLLGASSAWWRCHQVCIGVALGGFLLQGREGWSSPEAY
jgi:hypothetical protein